MRDGAGDVKTHKWFSGFDFGTLYNRGIPAPLVPHVSGANDTSNFDPYPDSVEAPVIPTYMGPDPFTVF